MSKLVFAPQTELQIQNFLARPAQALLLVGPEGAGKLAAAQFLAAELLGIDVELLEKYPYIQQLTPVKDSLSIDTIRAMQTGLQLKTLGSDRPIRRIVIISDAHTMTTEAQNALLKSLEEPPPDTVIILTAKNVQGLLPTITSRSQHITIKSPSLDSLREHFSDQFSSVAIEQAHRLSGGLPGLMMALLSADETHPLTQAVENVKVWLRSSSFERLALVDQLAKQKGELDIQLAALERVAQAALVQAAAKQQLAAVKRWQHILQLAVQTRRAYERNAQPKLLLTNLMLGL